MAKLYFLSLFFLLIILPQPCLAFDWGDFDKLAVVFGTILGFGLGFGAIVVVAYVACMRPFFNSFQEEVAQTHRSWHPWPIGSVRWQLQQLVRSGRSNEGKTQFIPMSHEKQYDAQNLNVPALQSTFPSAYSYAQSGEDMPTIRGPDYGYNQFQLQPSTTNYLYQEQQQQPIERPTYFTPSPEKPIFEEYTITREESFLSRGSMRRPPHSQSHHHHHFDDDNNIQSAGAFQTATSVPQEEAKIIRTTTTRHSQRSLKTAAGSTFI